MCSSLAKLRHDTAEAHKRLDEDLGIIDRLSDMTTRPGLVLRYYTFYRAIELATKPYLSGIADLKFEERCRTLLLADDLNKLGRCKLPDTFCQLSVMTTSAALGALYVSEGSTLGGRVILKELKGRKSSLTGLTFLDPYKNRTGALWKDFLFILERETGANEHCERELISGALKAFALAETTFAKESVH